MSFTVKSGTSPLQQPTPVPAPYVPSPNLGPASSGGGGSAGGSMTGLPPSNASTSNVNNPGATPPNFNSSTGSNPTNIAFPPPFTLTASAVCMDSVDNQNGGQFAGLTAAQQQAQRRGTDPSKYKTSICRNWEQTSSCSFRGCTFAHGVDELRAPIRQGGSPPLGASGAPPSSGGPPTPGMPPLSGNSPPLGAGPMALGNSPTLGPSAAGLPPVGAVSNNQNNSLLPPMGGGQQQQQQQQQGGGGGNARVEQLLEVLMTEVNKERDLAAVHAEANRTLEAMLRREQTLRTDQQSQMDAALDEISILRQTLKQKDDEIVANGGKPTGVDVPSHTALYAQRRNSAATANNSTNSPGISSSSSYAPNPNAPPFGLPAGFGGSPNNNISAPPGIAPLSSSAPPPPAAGGSSSLLSNFASSFANKSPSLAPQAPLGSSVSGGGSLSPLGGGMNDSGVGLGQSSSGITTADGAHSTATHSIDGPHNGFNGSNANGGGDINGNGHAAAAAGGEDPDKLRSLLNALNAPSSE